MIDGVRKMLFYENKAEVDIASDLNDNLSNNLWKELLKPLIYAKNKVVRGVDPDEFKSLKQCFHIVSDSIQITFVYDLKLSFELRKKLSQFSSLFLFQFKVWYIDLV